MTTEYIRGRRDSSRFDLVRQVGDQWQASRDCYADPIGLGELTDDYLRGLSDAGCPVVRQVERRAIDAIDNLLERIAFVMQ